MAEGKCAYSTCEGRAKYAVGSRKTDKYVHVCEDHGDAEMDLWVSKYGHAHMKLASLS